MTFQKKRRLIEYYKYPHGSCEFCIMYVNYIGAYEMIDHYLIDFFGYEPIFEDQKLPIGFQKENFKFWRFFDEWEGDYCVAAFNGKIETQEYYEKLEDLVKKLVDKLNEDGALLKLKELT